MRFNWNLTAERGPSARNLATIFDVIRAHGALHTPIAQLDLKAISDNILKKKIHNKYTYLSGGFKESERGKAEAENNKERAKIDASVSELEFIGHGNGSRLICSAQ